MPNNDAGNSGTAPAPNSFGDVRNLLGFLLAGFGAILTFLGVQSTEVTTILRNDTLQASLIALILLFGILAAVGTVATDNERTISSAKIVAITAVLVGIAALVVFAIPIEAATITTSGVLSLAIGCVFVLAGVATLLSLHFSGKREAVAAEKSEAVAPPAASHEASGGNFVLVGVVARLPQRFSGKKEAVASGESGGGDAGTSAPPLALASTMRLVDALILASVVLIAIAAYGAMRLETKSQLSFSSQVGAVFSVTGSLGTVAVNIDATKIAQSHWVFVDVYGLPASTHLNSACSHLYQNYTVDSDSAPCSSDPCLYFSQARYQSIATCTVLSNGSIVPNATGNVDEKISVPFLAADYQDIDVRAEVCSLSGGCEGSVIGQNSRLDWAVPNSPS
jgi:hypothetical protein